VSYAEKFVESVEWNFAKRIVLASAMNIRFWIGAFCVVAVLTVAGPFDTGDTLNLAQRFAYWLAISIGAYFITSFLGSLVFARAELSGWSQPIPSIISGLVAGVPVGLFVYFINALVVGNMQGWASDFIYLQAVCITINTAGALIHNLLCDEVVSASTTPDTISTAEVIETKEVRSGPSIMDRMSPQNRGEICSIKAQDHYIEVSTTRGKELILMRFSDALSELCPRSGRRVHRSWWVAKDAISDVIHKGDRICLELNDGRHVPVSRVNEGTVKEWLGFYALS